MQRSPNPKRESGKHGKYIPMLSQEVTKGVTMKPGRHICQCEASKHPLVNNCLHCGRIVCEQEGSGPCFTCKNLVCNPKEQEIISRQSKTSAKLYQKLMGDYINERNVENVKIQTPNNPSFLNALEQRNKLLEFDKTIERRAKVIDDENDYFEVESNRWLSAKERKILTKKKEEVFDALHGRKAPTLTFDFAGRKIVEETPQIKVDVDELLKSDTSIFSCEDPTTINIPLNYNPVYEEICKTKLSGNPLSEAERRIAAARIQDPELQGMSDDGMCLSLHQPHASLLAAGHKKHEGRIWYTNYRGRLWIHAGGKNPTVQDIREIESLYRLTRGDCNFPESYPTGCLLGCVDLVDCLPQEEYREQYPGGEAASPYVLICKNARELIIKFPMKGKHKIFTLDSKIHQAAKKTLKKKM